MRSESTAVEPIAAFVDACPDMLCTLDVEGRLLWANRAFLSGMGCSLPAVGEAGEPLAERAEQEQRSAFKAALEVRVGGWHGPMRVASGAIQRLAWTWGGDAGGQRYASVRLMSEASLPSAEERARALIRGTDAGVIDYGPGGEVLSWNAAATRIFGYSAEEMLGRPGDILRAPGSSTDVDARAAEALLAGRAFREVIPNKTKDGRIIACDWEIVLLRDGQGTPIGTAAMVRDVTALEEQRRTLERQRDTIRALSTPILDVWEGVLALPLIGDIDAVRAEQILDALLQEIVSSQSRFAILDLTGVEVIDTTTVHHLVRLLKAISLLGAQGILTGMRPAVAQALVSLGAELPGVPTLGNLRAGLQRCMRDSVRPRRHPRG